MVVKVTQSGSLTKRVRPSTDFGETEKRVGRHEVGIVRSRSVANSLYPLSRLKGSWKSQIRVLYFQCVTRVMSAGLNPGQLTMILAARKSLRKFDAVRRRRISRGRARFEHAIQHTSFFRNPYVKIDYPCYPNVPTKGLLVKMPVQFSRRTYTVGCACRCGTRKAAADCVRDRLPQKLEAWLSETAGAGPGAVVAADCGGALDAGEQSDEGEDGDAHRWAGLAVVAGDSARACLSSMSSIELMGSRRVHRIESCVHGSYHHSASQARM